MTGTTRIPKAEMTGVRAAVVKRMARKMLGEVPDGLEVGWHNRKVLTFGFALGRKTRKWHECDQSLKAFAHMATASYVGCSACLDLGYYQAHTDGLDMTKAREVPRWRESDVFTPLERRVMEYAEAMSQTPSAVTDELVEALLEDLDPASLLELTSRIGFMNASARGNIALGIRSEAFSAACGFEPLATPSSATV